MGEAIKRGDHLQEVDDETMVEIGEADSQLDLLDIGWGWPPANGFGFGCIYCNSWFDVKVMFMEARESASDMVLVNIL